ncbi:hypothetical protein VTI74DRAFT_7733 [Chaetomium olivicolor]
MQSFTLSNDDSTDSESGDLLAAIRRVQKAPGFHLSEPPSQQNSQLQTGSVAINTPLSPSGVVARGLDALKTSANDETKAASTSQLLSNTRGSSFLTKYDYTGKKRHDPKTKKHKPTAARCWEGAQHEGSTIPKHSRKRPSPEVIDLTGTVDNPSPVTYRERKRQRLDEHGREKRQRTERAVFQAFDPFRKDGKSGSSQRDRRKRVKSDLQSKSSRKSKDSFRRKNRHTQQRERETGRPRGPQHGHRGDRGQEPFRATHQATNQGSPRTFLLGPILGSNKRQLRTYVRTRFRVFLINIESSKSLHRNLSRSIRQDFTRPLVQSWAKPKFRG